MTVTVITDAKKLNAHVNKIGKSAVSMKADIHTACVSIVLKHVDDGDTTQVNNLITTLLECTKDVTHGNAVHRWFEEYGCFTWSSKEKAFKHDKDKVEKAKANENFAEGIINSKPYYEVTKAPEFKPMVLASRIKSILNKIDKMTAEELEDKRNDLTGLEELRKWGTKYLPA